MRDRYGREIDYLRLSVTDLCNLRCRYCMPEAGVCKKQHGDMLTEDEMIDVVAAAASLGVRKVRITGGEPLVKRNILSICRRAAAVPGIETLCLTTNGTLLPELAAPLRQAGVTRLNISLDTLQEEKFAAMTRRGGLQRTLDGIEAALSAGFEKIKLNAVLIGGYNDDEIPALAALTRRWPVDVRFIELMPMYDGGDFGPEAYLSADAVLQALPEAEPLPWDGGVAKRCRLPGAQGNLGLIRPVSCQFCANCSRIRVMADGTVKPCLHQALELSLKGLDRAAMTDCLCRAILAKPADHGPLSAQDRSRAGRNMNQIGG